MLSLVAQKDSHKKLSMWDYLQVEIYRFCYVLRVSATSKSTFEDAIIKDFVNPDPKSGENMKIHRNPWFELSNLFEICRKQFTIHTQTSPYWFRNVST